MKKCETCIWADKRSGIKIVCPFIRCVKAHGFKADKEMYTKGVHEEKRE